MGLFSELKLPLTNGYDNDWGFFVEIDLVSDPTSIQKENYYNSRYYLLYKQQQRQYQLQFLPTISEDNSLETTKKYENIIMIKITYYVVISAFIFFILSVHL